jgi:hypothetical protein
MCLRTVLYAQRFARVKCNIRVFRCKLVKYTKSRYPLMGIMHKYVRRIRVLCYKIGDLRDIKVKDVEKCNSSVGYIAQIGWRDAPLMGGFLHVLSTRYHKIVPCFVVLFQGESSTILSERFTVACTKQGVLRKSFLETMPAEEHAVAVPVPWVPVPQRYRAGQAELAPPLPLIAARCGVRRPERRS